MTLSENTKRSTNWNAIITFYIIACLWSWPVFWFRDFHRESYLAIELPNYLKTWMIMWGPGVSAIICFYLFKNHKRSITFKGTNCINGIVFFCALPLSLAIWNFNPFYLLIGVIAFISSLGEELGWRGFLQDALSNMSDIKKAIVIGVLWELWHFTNRFAGKEILDALKSVSLFMVSMILVSYIMIKLTNSTKSLMIPITIHTAVNSIFEFPMGWQAVVSCLPVWFLLIYKWGFKINMKKLDI